MIEAEIYTALSGSTLVTSATSNRIYPVQLPQTPTFPAVTYQRVTGGQFNGISGFVSLENPTIQVDIWGTTYKATKDLAIAVHKVMKGSTSYTANLTSDQDIVETLGDNEQVYRVSQDYSCMNATTY